MYDIIQMKNKIYIIEDNQLVEKYDSSEDINSLEGNIYVGKIENVLKGLKMAFVSIGNEKTAVLPFSDLSNKYNDEQILEKLKPGNEILVQVKRQEIGSKGPKLTTKISLVGKYLVFMPNDDFVTMSSKLLNIDERNRLGKIVRGILPKGTGAIVRTEAKWKTPLEMQEDLQNILTKWKTIKKDINKNKIVPNLIYENLDLLDKVITNITPLKINQIITDQQDVYEKYKSKIKVVYQKEFQLTHTLEKQLETSKSRKVWLKCGAYITIDKTEALIAIDVNSAKYVGKTDAEDTFFKVNKEATVEIAKQIRLRNLSGMILIDYINMEDTLHRSEIFQLLKEELKSDRSKTEVLGFTNLNLLEMTRQHLNG